MDNQVKLFKALSDQSRLRILKMLEIRALCVCEIREILDLATSTVSQHLAILRNAGFIYDIKDAKWVVYHLNRQNADEVVQSLFRVLQDKAFSKGIYREDAAQVREVNRNKLCGL
ncbi:MAG TPA: metalloregulator ArsR/SmtB family transcription factor [bacterium]|nr:metalloregulator ArsR/SmtB family transcription factor [bacterium]HNT67004.1 metalloregulator ArsR/SmtB family transcription factor [bacterium]HOX86899.1 metalloregulator ArsR/SmtB family transcription factor [bacterium]HPG46230.1 metalloregulator ArsR/SmtB family transcription factor [bacterium]HPM98576.1 metalloregulator ArsR/SmtB family transcription factor [bacterium]